MLPFANSKSASLWIAKKKKCIRHVVAHVKVLLYPQSIVRHFVFLAFAFLS